MLEVMNTNGNAVRVRGLRKRYRKTGAVEGVDFDIVDGEVFALLGPNGAGKTTTVEILLKDASRPELAHGSGPRSAARPCSRRRSPPGYSTGYEARIRPRCRPAGSRCLRWWRRTDQRGGR
jgi:hypothetical protein